MNLIVDVGNSLVKVAVFEAHTMVSLIKITSINLKKELLIIIKEHQINKIIISSVGHLDFLFFEFLPQENTIYLNQKSKFPFKNKYSTPTTLGVDRLALVAAAYNFKKNQNILIIDAGTCITYDFLRSDNTYLGGAISPGIAMRYRALSEFTTSLPLLNIEMPDSVIGNSTNTCIHSGIVNGVILEMEGMISHYNNNYKDLTVILTGGDTNFLSKQLKSSIFANSNFLLEGLNYLLNLNLKE